MGRLLNYYRRIISLKVQFWKNGKLLKIPFSIKLFHNSDMFSLKYASKLSKIIYDSYGRLRSYSEYKDLPEYKDLIRIHNEKSKYSIEYWKSHGLVRVPINYVKEHILDQMINEGMNPTNYLSVVRDRFFLDYDPYDYRSQILEVFEKYLS